MENNYKIINRINISKYSNQNNNTGNKIKSYTSYNLSKRINTEINNRNNSNNNKNNENLNHNVVNNKNLLLTRKYQIRTPNENIKLNYDMNNKNRENNHNINENKRNNNFIFVRKETKKENKNNNNNSTYLNKETNSITFNKEQYINKFNQNNISSKQKPPLTNFQNYRNFNTQRISQNKSFQSNYSRDSKTNNTLNNEEKSEVNKENISYTNNNNYLRKYSRNINQNKEVSKEINIENKIEKEEENLMDIVNKQIGIKNIGNTCFINSSLQIFIHCPLFISKLISKMKLINENTQVTSNFLSICNLMLNTKTKYVSIYSFKSLLGLKHKIFFGYMQNDSQEFIRIFLEDISQELNEAKENTLFRLLSNSDSKSKKIRDEDFHINFSRREKSIITETFYAQIVNIYTCQCKSMIFSFQKILDFPLLFPEKINNNMISLYELLRLYFSVEFIEFESKCERCKKIEKHKKELKISRPPEILILSLQRIDLVTGKKLEYKVKFSQKLDLYDFTDHDLGYDNECKYELFGVINHIGNLNSGHYFSYIKNENKEWIEYNDSIVRKINYFSDCSDSVYAIFYIKEKYNNMNSFKQ